MIKLSKVTKFSNVFFFPEQNIKTHSSYQTLTFQSYNIFLELQQKYVSENDIFRNISKNESKNAPFGTRKCNSFTKRIFASQQNPSH